MMVTQMREPHAERGHAAVRREGLRAWPASSRKDFDHVMLYDAFTSGPPIMLESLGFCQAGRGRVASSRRAAPRRAARCPINTNGGGLSYTHTGMYGIFPIIEAVPPAARRVRRAPGAERASCRWSTAWAACSRRRAPWCCRTRSEADAMDASRDAREAKNLAVVKRLGGGFARHDLDAILDCFTDDGIFDITGGPGALGRAVPGQGRDPEGARVARSPRCATCSSSTRGLGGGDRGVSEWTCVATTPRAGRSASAAATSSSSATA